MPWEHVTIRSYHEVMRVFWRSSTQAVTWVMSRNWQVKKAEGVPETIEIWLNWGVERQSGWNSVMEALGRRLPRRTVRDGCLDDPWKSGHGIWTIFWGKWEELLRIFDKGIIWWHLCFRVVPPDHCVENGLKGLRVKEGRWFRNLYKWEVVRDLDENSADEDEE